MEVSGWYAVTVQGVELTEDQIELPDDPVTSPKQITVYLTVSCHYFAVFH